MVLFSVLWLLIFSFFLETGGFTASQLSVRVFNGLFLLGIYGKDIDPSFRPHHITPGFNNITSSATTSSMITPASLKAK